MVFFFFNEVRDAASNSAWYVLRMSEPTGRGFSRLLEAITKY
jgi:hypothetical protein